MLILLKIKINTFHLENTMLVVDLNILNQLIKKKMKETKSAKKERYHIVQLVYIRFAFGRSKLHYGHTKNAVNADKLS